MRAFLIALAVVATFLLAVIALELAPIARVASATLSISVPAGETRAARTARLQSETREANADLDAILNVGREARDRRTPSAPPASTFPAPRP